MATPSDFSCPPVAFYYDRQGNEMSRDDFKARFGVERSSYRRMAIDCGPFRFVAIWPVCSDEGADECETDNLPMEGETPHG